MEPEGPLREWIRAHRVRYEISRYVELSSQKHRRLAATELCLFAEAASLGEDPGSPESYRLYQVLREVAGQVLPAEHEGSAFEIEPFDASFHLRPSADWVPEVVLRVRILHAPTALRGPRGPPKRASSRRWRLGFVTWAPRSAPGPGAIPGGERPEPTGDDARKRARASTT